MPQDSSDLDKFNNPEVLRVVWDTFAEIARKPGSMDSSTYFSLDGQNSVTHLAFDRCLNANLIPPNVRRFDYPPFKHIVLKVYYSALGMGLVLPSNLTQALDHNAHIGPFHFTADGVQYFRGGFVSIDDPGHLPVGK